MTVAASPAIVTFVTETVTCFARTDIACALMTCAKLDPFSNSAIFCVAVLELEKKLLHVATTAFFDADNPDGVSGVFCTELFFGAEEQLAATNTTASNAKPTAVPRVLVRKRQDRHLTVMGICVQQRCLHPQCATGPLWKRCSGRQEYVRKPTPKVLGRRLHRGFELTT